METLLILFAIQAGMGAFDTIYHHEFKEMLPWRRAAGTELKLHGIRNLFYCIIFISLAFVEWHGALVLLLAAILLVEIIITLWDFVVEDQTRSLPASERVMHTLLAINYGVILALFTPVLMAWYAQPTGLAWVYHGVYSWLFCASAIAVLLWSFRDSWAGMHLSQAVTREAKTSSAEAKNYLVTGGSGFIGRRLCQQLIDQGHHVTIVTRDFKKTAALMQSKVTLVSSINELGSNSRFDVIINLAGEPVFARWTRKKKQMLLQSRLNLTKALVNFVAHAEYKPAVFISGSAIGFYGSRADQVLTEDDTGAACFSHQLCQAWEQTAQTMEQYGVRVCLLRTGIVLGMGGGTLASLLFPFQFGLGGRIGNGRQWMSWIHLDDLIAIILFCANHHAISGPVNGVSPNPVTNLQLTKALAQVLRRPAVFITPAWLLQWTMGEVADELLLASQRVQPEKLLSLGFKFQHPELVEALRKLIANPI